MRPIYKHDIEFPGFWPGVVLTTDTEQRYLNQAVGALSNRDGLEPLVKEALAVERFTEPTEDDMQAHMNHAWRVTGGDDDPSIFPGGRALDMTHAEMALDALKIFMTCETNLDPPAIERLIKDMDDNLTQSRNS